MSLQSYQHGFDCVLFGHCSHLFSPSYFCIPLFPHPFGDGMKKKLADGLEIICRLSAEPCRVRTTKFISILYSYLWVFRSLEESLTSGQNLNIWDVEKQNLAAARVFCINRYSDLTGGRNKFCGWRFAKGGFAARHRCPLCHDLSFRRF